MRIIGALPLAMTPMTWSEFTVLNSLSAITWTFALVGTGYVFGSALEHTIGDNWGIFSISLLVIFILISYLAWRRIGKLSKLQ